MKVLVIPVVDAYEMKWAVGSVVGRDSRFSKGWSRIQGEPIKGCLKGQGFIGQELAAHNGPPQVGSAIAVDVVAPATEL